MKLKFNRKHFFLNYLLFISLYLVIFYFVEGGLSQERIISSLIVSTIVSLLFSIIGQSKKKQNAE